MSEQLLRAAGRLDVPVSEDAVGSSLRREQSAVFHDAAAYLLDIATRPDGDIAPPFGRIILPPRTGKTVIAAHLIARSGLTAAIIVPTRTLVHQTYRELLLHAPKQKVGVFCGERKSVVEDGVNVLTYTILRRAWEHGTLPPAIRRSGLVFADEAHHAMTPERSDLLHTAFDPLAVRLALTATPDYGRERQLRHYFPDLVHEIDLAEALALDLLAPARVWVAEVDVDASVVRFIAGDYEAETLGRLMSTAPFLRAVEVFRYLPENAAIPALVTCASRQQAYDLWRYLQAHRPKGRPAPALILGETPGAERERLLGKFERGRLDTLIQVGVLIEGWNSPRCKLLIDLAPSASRVRATQKYFRVMTRLADAEARIYVFLPKDLPRLPVLPMDLFGQFGEYECGEIIGRPKAHGDERPLVPHTRTPVAGVEIKQRVVLSGVLEKPGLDPASAADTRAVLASCAEFEVRRPCGPRQFRWLWFNHPLFKGRGDLLLRWVGVERSNVPYYTWLGRLYPVLLADFAAGWLTKEASSGDGWCEEDVAAIVRLIEAAKICRERVGDILLALAGTRAALDPNPESLAIRRDAVENVLMLFKRLQPRERGVLEMRFGLGGEVELTWNAIGDRLSVSTERARQIAVKAMRKLRGWMIRTDKGLLKPRGDRK